MNAQPAELRPAQDAPSPMREGWLRATRRLPPLQIAPAYALPLRIFATLFAAGDVAFLAGMLASPWLAFAAAAIVATSVWMLFHRVAPADDIRGSPLAPWLVALPIALLLCLLGGEGRLLYANPDWAVRDAVLADLAARPWPVHYTAAELPALVLRAPLGLYMLPALVGQVAGLNAAHLALLAQNTLLLAGVFATVTAKVASLRTRLGVAAVFVAFSGWDVVGTQLNGYTLVFPGASPYAPHLEWWATPFQYSSLITDLFWAPNHALPAFALVALYTAWRSGAASSLHLAAMLGLTLLWSPLVVIGALPFVLLALLTDIGQRRMGLLAPAVLAPLAAALLPVAVYLTLDDAKVTQGLNTERADFLFRYARFIALDLVPLLVLGLVWVRAQPRSARLDLLACAVLLLALPFYRIGGSNDLLMRASIFPITLIFVIVAHGLAGATRADRWRRLSLPILAIGAMTPAMEIARPFLTPLNPPFASSLIEVMGNDLSSNYLHAYTAETSTYGKSGLFRAPAGDCGQPSRDTPCPS